MERDASGRILSNALGTFKQTEIRMTDEMFNGPQEDNHLPASSSSSSPSLSLLLPLSARDHRQTVADRFIMEPIL